MDIYRSDETPTPLPDQGPIRLEEVWRAAEDLERATELERAAWRAAKLRHDQRSIALWYNADCLKESRSRIFHELRKLYNAQRKEVIADQKIA